MRVYDGESLKDTDPKAKSYQEYRDYAGVDEGMNGLSTRFAFKILSRVFNFDHVEVAANPVHLFYVPNSRLSASSSTRAGRTLSGVPERLSDPEICRVYRQRDPDGLP